MNDFASGGTALLKLPLSAPSPPPPPPPARSRGNLSYKRLALVILGSVSAKECFFFHHNVFCITYFVMYNVFSYELPKVIYY